MYYVTVHQKRLCVDRNDVCTDSGGLLVQCLKGVLVAFLRGDKTFVKRQSIQTKPRKSAKNRRPVRVRSLICTATVTHWLGL